jgi:ABC-type sugar transport system ATPase subunit
MSAPSLDTATPPKAASEALVRMTGIVKAFGATQALRGSSFDLQPGEVHALVGENGSGKSTLIKILSGVHAADAGMIELDGTQLAALRTPRMAQERGIVTVFQEVLVAPARSVLENVWLGTETPFRAHVGPREKRVRAAELLERLLGTTLNLDTPVEELSLSDRQACCIVRAILRNPRVLILDEATSALDIATRDRLFEIVNTLIQGGAGVVFITHRMDELSVIGDRITVMRSGVTVATLERGGWTSKELVRLMTGAEQLAGGATDEIDALEARRGEVLLSARGLQLRKGRQPFDLAIHAGELVGVAGLEGHGQDDLLEVLRGGRPIAGEVIRHQSGEEVVIVSPGHAAEEGIVYVPRERIGSIFRWMSIRENFGMPTLARDSRGGWLSLRRTRRRFQQYIGQLNIVLGNDGDAITTLSGGNQQKVVIARWLAAQPRVLLLNDPTRGIDIGAKRDLYRLLVTMASAGLAVVMLSTELDEHVELMDRVLIFREQELSVEIARGTLSRQTLVSGFFGRLEDGDG